MAQIAGACQIAFLQAEHTAALLQGALEDPAMSAQQGTLLLSPHPAAGTPPAAATSAQAPAAADALAVIAIAPRSSTTRQQRARAAGGRQAAKACKHKAASSAASGAQGDAEEMKERKSELLRFGQEVADQALTKLAASGSPSDGLDMASVMQLLQPIVDKMLQDNPEALGEPITPEHMAYISAEGLRYEQIEQLFCQGLKVGEAAKHVGMGKTKFNPITRQFGIKEWPYRAFTSIYNAQQYLDTNSSSTKNTAVVPGRRLLLLHALELLRQHPNMTFSEHPASVVKERVHSQKHKRVLRERQAAEEGLAHALAAQVLADIKAAGSSSSGSKKRRMV